MLADHSAVTGLFPLIVVAMVPRRWFLCSLTNIAILPSQESVIYEAGIQALRRSMPPHTDTNRVHMA